MEKKKSAEEWFGFSLHSFAAVLAGILLFGTYVGILLFGENSLMVLKKLEHEKEQLRLKSEELRTSNQKLQKSYFELLQIAGR